MKLLLFSVMAACAVLLFAAVYFVAYALYWIFWVLTRI